MKREKIYNEKRRDEISKQLIYKKKLLPLLKMETCTLTKTFLKINRLYLAFYTTYTLFVHMLSCFYINEIIPRGAGAGRETKAVLLRWID